MIVVEGMVTAGTRRAAVELFSPWQVFFFTLTFFLAIILIELTKGEEKEGKYNINYFAACDGRAGLQFPYQL